MILVWLNGPSAELLIDSIPRQSFEIGCNYIEKRRSVDAVCAYDINVVQTIKLQKNIQYYTRPDAVMPFWKVLQGLSGTNSGILAFHVATLQPKQPIYIIGCDWGLTSESIFQSEYNQKESNRKYVNAHKRIVKRMFENHTVKVINDQIPDIDLPVISINEFQKQISNK
tara:strand:- start:1814 stop:2320 length:507 start_codon:yes stop_codon:yes gene_type:complete